MTPEEQARVKLDGLLEQAGWAVQDAAAINLYTATGVAVREFSLKPGHGAADYLLFVNRKAVGVVEAKPEGFILTGVEVQVRGVQPSSVQPSRTRHRAKPRQPPRGAV